MRVKLHFTFNLSLFEQASKPLSHRDNYIDGKNYLYDGTLTRKISTLPADKSGIACSINRFAAPTSIADVGCNAPAINTKL